MRLPADCTGEHDVMARQVRPRSGKSALPQGLRARVGDKNPISKFHQGQRLSPRESPDVWLQSLLTGCHGLRAWQMGASMYVGGGGGEPCPLPDWQETAHSRFRPIGADSPSAGP